MTAYIYSFVVANEEELRNAMGTSASIDKRVSLVSANHQKLTRLVKGSSAYFLMHRSNDFYDFGFVEMIRSPASGNKFVENAGWFQRNKETGKIKEIKKPSWWRDFGYPYSFR